MPRTLSSSIAEFLRANTPPHISAEVRCPSRSDVDSYEWHLSGGTVHEREELSKLMNAFVFGWSMCRLAQEEEDHKTIKLRHILVPR